MTLNEFLLARITEDEADAKHAAEADGIDWEWDGSPIGGVGSTPGSAIDLYADVGAHVARHDPARVLAECEAKRRIVESFPEQWSTDLTHVAGIGTEPEFDWWEDRDGARHDMREGRPPGSVAVVPAVLKFLALPYAEHPEYRQEWTP